MAVAFVLLRTPTLVFGLCALGCLSVALVSMPARPWLLPLWLALGALSWLFVEYVGHRFVSHARRANPSHHRHHVEPSDVSQVPVSLSATVPGLFGLVGLLWFASVGDRVMFGGVSAGLLLGYVASEWVHMAAHLDELSRGRRWLLALSQNHLDHHFRDARRNFGITCGLFDWVFRTSLERARR